MITLKSLGKFVLSAIIAYAILLGIFVGLKGDIAYKAATVSAMKSMHSTYTKDGKVAYSYQMAKSKAQEMTEYILVTVSSRKIQREMEAQAAKINKDAGFQKIKKLDIPQAQFRLEIWENSLVPLILLMVLILSTPIPWKRRIFALVIGVSLFHLFLWFKYWVRLTVEVNRHEWMGITNLQGFWKNFYLYANTYLYFIGTSLAVVIVIWILSCFRKADFEKLSESFAEIGNQSEQ